MPPATDAAPPIRFGGLITLLGAAGQLGYGVDVWRRRGRWTTDGGWHRLTSWHLSAALGWYLLAVTTVLVGVVRDGPAPAGWSLGGLAIPLVGGWVLQVLVGAWTHLLPAVGSTDPAARAAYRATLGRFAVARLEAWNAAVLLAWLGLGTGALPVAFAGAVAFVMSVLLAVGLVVRARFGARIPVPAS